MVQIRHLSLLFQTAPNSTEDVKLRTSRQIVGFQYVLCDKVTDHSGPEIYAYLFTTNKWLLISKINVNFCIIIQLTELNVQHFCSFLIC